MKNNKKTNFIGKQLCRIKKIVLLLKKRDSVTIKEISEYLAEAVDEADESLACSEKTIYRDFNDLKDYGFPVEYVAEKHHYVLKDKNWALPIPLHTNEVGLLAAYAGANFAQEIFPESFAEEVTTTVNDLITAAGTSPSLAKNRLASLFILSTEKNPKEPDSNHFRIIFNAWKNCQCLKIQYKSRGTKKNKDGEVELRLLEPQGLVYYGANWYILARCRRLDATRTFAFEKIQEVYAVDESFTPDPKVYESFNERDMHHFSNFQNVKILLSKAGVNRARRRKLNLGQKIRRQKDGTHILYTEHVGKQQVLNWIVERNGEATPLEPKELVDEVRELAEKLLKGLGNSRL